MRVSGLAKPWQQHMAAMQACMACEPPKKTGNQAGLKQTHNNTGSATYGEKARYLQTQPGQLSTRPNIALSPNVAML